MTSLSPFVRVSYRRPKSHLTLCPDHHTLSVKFEGDIDNLHAVITSIATKSNVSVPFLSGHQPDETFDTVTRIDLPGKTFDTITFFDLLEHTTSVIIRLHLGASSVFMTISTYRPGYDFYTRSRSRSRTRSCSRSRSRSRSPPPAEPLPYIPVEDLSPLPTEPIPLNPPLVPMKLSEYTALIGPDLEQIRLLEQLLTMKGIPIPKMSLFEMCWWTFEVNIENSRKVYAKHIDALNAALVSSITYTS